MNYKKIFFLVAIISLCSFCFYKNYDDNNFITYSVDLKKYQVDFYWKNKNGKNFGSLQNLKNFIESKNKKLLFATNGGMYQKDKSPQGLFIQENKILQHIDTLSGNGNFYLKPNGIFYITNEKQPVICKTENFIFSKNIKYATQSGPMLLIDGEIHSVFNKDSKNINIRNGVGVLPNNNVVFVMSKTEVNFYDFANYFKKLGCKNALYLDGFVSRTYLPEKNFKQMDGDFGVIIGVTSKK
jgi:uncharacterized protein YigE (DUF2233 family)